MRKLKGLANGPLGLFAKIGLMWVVCLLFAGMMVYDGFSTMSWYPVLILHGLAGITALLLLILSKDSDEHWGLMLIISVISVILGLVSLIFVSISRTRKWLEKATILPPSMTGEMPRRPFSPERYNGALLKATTLE
jgi:hypothetical protein